MMGSKKAELYQISVGQKRKNLDARAFKALFKRQRIKEALPDIHGKLEGPDDMSHICNGNGRVISSKPIGEGEDVSDEFFKSLKGNSRHLSIDEASGGDLQKSIGNLRKTNSEILGNNVTVDSNDIDDVIAESPKPSFIDAKTDSSTRKSFDDSERLPTGCSITENTSTSGSVDCMVGPQHVDPAIGELTELQGTQGAISKEGHSTITATNLVETLQVDSISTDDVPNSMSVQRSFGAEVGTGALKERFSLLSEQNNRHNSLRVELGRLCQILKLSEDVTHRVREFLEYAIQNHNLSSYAPAIMHAFQLSVCWIATLIAKQKVDVKEYFNLAKKHLNYQCTEEQVHSVYSKMLPLKSTYLQSSENTSDSGKDFMLIDEDRSKEPSHIIDCAPLFLLLKDKQAKVEIEEIVEIILKQKLGMNVTAAGSEIHDKIKKNWKKCGKRMMKLVRKQEEEVHGLLRTWEEEKVKLEKDHKLETAFTCFIYGQGLVQTSKLNILVDKFANKMEEHNLLKDMQLNSLKEKQIAAQNEVCQKAADWLAEAISYASKLGTVNGPQPFGFQSEKGPACTGSGTHDGLDNVVTLFQEHAVDPNPSINLCSQGNDVAPSNASIGVLAKTTDSGYLAETMSNMEPFSSPNEVGVMSLERLSETLVGQVSQLFQSCNTTEEIGATNLPVCGEHITDEIRPIEMYQEGLTELTRPVSDDIVLHGDPMESNNTTNIGDSIGLPNTEVNHRSEPCQSGNCSLPFPGQPLVHSEEMLAFPDHRGLLKQQVSQNEIHQVVSAELEDRDTPAAEIQNTSQVEVATSKLGDAVTLVQSNHAVPVTGNGEQLNHLSADAPLVCIQYRPHEIEHQNRDQGTNFSPTVVAGEREDFSHEFISHHNHLDLGQACRISHEQNVEYVRSPDNTVLSEVASTTELPNQSAPQLRIDADHFHGPINNDEEITRSTCVRESQNKIHQVASAELEKLDTPAVETKNTSQTEVASGAVTFVQSNHAVPVTRNYEQLRHLSVDASLIYNQSSPNGIDHQNGDQVSNISQTIEAGETEEFSHEFVSQSNANLLHNHLYMGQASRISCEQSVEVLVRSKDNTFMDQAVSTTELPNQSVPQLGIDAGRICGPSHLLVHPTLPVTSWNSTPSLVAEPLQNELEKLLKEAERLEKIYKDAVSQFKSACEKEIEEIINQIRTKYYKKFQDAEENFRLKKNELEKSKNLVLMNAKLAEAFRSKFQFRPLQLQQVFPSSFEQHLQQPSLPPSMRISPLESRPPPSQQTLAPSAEALNQLHMLPPVRSSPVAIRNATASQPIQRAGSVLSVSSARPLVIASHTPAAYPGIVEIRSKAPHLQPFRLAAAPSMAPSSFSAIPQWHPPPVFPPQLVATTRPAPRPPQVMPNHVSQNAPEPRSRQHSILASLNHLSIAKGHESPC